ncbi:hypothetical protein RDABS01_010715 [Bienertia sinuspersici]
MQEVRVGVRVGERRNYSDRTFRELHTKRAFDIFSENFQNLIIDNIQTILGYHHLILLQELDSSIQPSDIELINCPFWVRIYNLPFDYRTKEHALILASKIGEVLEVEDDIIGWDKSMRVRVMLNTCKPLRRMQKIRNNRGETCWVEFKYQRLPFFCYKCGVMGHTERDCQKEESEGDEKGRQWGAWLKASPRKGIASREEEIQQLNKTKKALVFHTKQNRKSGEEYGTEGREEKNGGSNSEVRRTGNDERFEERSGDLNVIPRSETQINKANSSEQESSNLVEINSDGTGNREMSRIKWKRILTHRVPSTREQANDDDIERKTKGVVDMEVDPRSPEAVDSLHDLVKQESPHLIFLVETKCFSQEIMRIKRRLGFKNGVMVDARGRAGGLAMMWSDDLDVTLRKMGEKFIDVTIKEASNFTWRLTGVYGWSEGNQKHKTWNLLQDLGEQNNLPWAIMGDFNEVLLECEKKGGNPCDFASIQQFRSVVDQLGMHDLKADGYYYTWSNRRIAEDLIEERLDQLRSYTTSDKDGRGKSAACKLPPTKLFRFEAKWLQEENFDDTMVGLWSEAMEEGGHDWSSVVRNCGQKLEDWDKKTYRLVPRRIKWLKSRLNHLRKMNQSSVVVEEMRQVEKELKMLRRSQETAAWQRCRPMVLKEGDKNTAYFHHKASERIKRLQDADGVLHYQEEEIEGIVRCCWREDILQEVFLPIDIKRIQNVPISARFPEDVMYWKGSNDGVFRVREAYRLAIMEDQAACSNESDPIWRIRTDRSCARCEVEEDNLHALRDCSWVRRIWEGGKASWCKSGAASFREWFAWMSGENKYGQLEAFAIVTWSIWNARNDLIFEDQYCSPEACCNKAMDLLQEFQRVNNTALNHERRRTEAKWQPPRDDVIKVNFDAAISTEFDRVGLGIIGRDVGGKVIFAKARTMCNKWESEKGEAHAALEAIETARREGCTKIMIEGDALIVIQALQQHTTRGGPV